jgi:hypothetical protein
MCSTTVHSDEDLSSEAEEPREHFKLPLSLRNEATPWLRQQLNLKVFG